MDSREERRQQEITRLDHHEAYYIDGGYRYLKTGDYTGEICDHCGGELMVDKTQRAWIFYCHCGHTEEFYRRDRMGKKRYPRSIRQEALDKIESWTDVESTR